jgi:hypothetical protein
MNDIELEARIEMSIVFMHAWIDERFKYPMAPDKFMPSWLDDTEHWLRAKGFYDKTVIIPGERHQRWRVALGLPLALKVERDFNEDGTMINYI